MSFTRVLIVFAEKPKTSFRWTVESRFCKIIGCSYVTLFAMYLARKKNAMFWVSNRNTRRRCQLISKITLKTSERSHLTASYLPEVTVQNHILDSLSYNIYQFAIKSLLSVLLSSLTVRNFNNSRPIYVILCEMRNHYKNIWFMKNSKFQHFLFLKKQPQKWTNFPLLNLIFKGLPFQYHKVTHPNFP